MPTFEHYLYNSDHIFDEMKREMIASYILVGYTFLKEVSSAPGMSLSEFNDPPPSTKIMQCSME